MEKGEKVGSCSYDGGHSALPILLVLLRLSSVNFPGKGHRGGMPGESRYVVKGDSAAVEANGMNIEIDFLLRRLLPWRDSGAGVRKPKTALAKPIPFKRIAFAAVVAGILVVAGVIIVWYFDEDEPDALVLLINVEPYDTTLYAPVDGHILWKIRFMIVYYGEQPVTVDIHDFSAVASNGTEYHFAWRSANLTCFEIVEKNFTTHMEVPRTCWITAPFELPQTTYPVQIIWRSALGEFLSMDLEEWWHSNVE